MSSYLKKAPFNDWWYWSDVLGKRLRTIADIYRENDEKERALEIGALAKKLYDLFMGPARKGQKIKTMKPEEKEALRKEEEATIFEGTNMWRDILAELPFISDTVEGFLALKWEEINPNTKKEKEESEKGKAGSAANSLKKIDPRAIELFWGPMGRYDEGIRSGLPEDGGLPGILMNYIMAEKTSSNRSPTEYKDNADFKNSYGVSSVNNIKPPGFGGM